jgi:spoIIIJ-associated protein
MEENEKDRGDEEDSGLESERSDFYESESHGKRLRGDGAILQEFDKRRREGKVEYVRSVLEGILFRMGVEAMVEGQEGEGEIRLEIKGGNSGLLIGKHGRTLDSLQYVVNKVYQRRFAEGERVLLDAENYRKRRVEALENLALRLGEKAKRKRRAVVAGVFNSRDRRIIHMARKEDASLETESRGEGFYKKLVIRPRVRSGAGEIEEEEAS